MQRHLATIWEALADATPDELALVQGDVRRTWREFEDRAARFAAALEAAGLGAGSKFALYLYNCPEYLEAFFAGIKIGAIPCNVNYRYLDDELIYLLENSEAEAIVFHSSLGERVEAVLGRAPGVKLTVEVADDDRRVPSATNYDELIASTSPTARRELSPDDHYMIYTGGTTGMPKGVITTIGPLVDAIVESLPPLIGLGRLTVDDLVDCARDMADAGGQIASMPAAPLMHNTGFGLGALPALVFGGRVVLLDGRKFDPQALWDTVVDEGVTAVTIVGDAFARPMLRALEERPGRDLSSVILIASSGAMFSTDVKSGLLEHVPNATIFDLIASTEVTVGVSLATAGMLPATGQFLPMPGVTVLDDDDRPLVAGSGVAGRLAAPVGAASGYFKDDAKTAETFREVGGKRYVIPGDFATIEADGMITLLGRGSVCINTGGEKVFPEEVEEAVKVVPEIEDCLVFGVPDERFGQRVVGVASLRPGESTTEADVIAALTGRLAPYKVPRELLLVDEVPRIASGKADYPAARELYEVHQAARA